VGEALDSCQHGSDGSDSVPTGDAHLVYFCRSRVGREQWLNRCCYCGILGAGLQKRERHKRMQETKDEETEAKAKFISHCCRPSVAMYAERQGRVTLVDRSYLAQSR
jgi:hypothetical protein